MHAGTRTVSGRPAGGLSVTLAVLTASQHAGVQETPPIRLCFLVDTLGPDAGTERLVATLARRLDRARFDLHVCCFEDSHRLRELGAVCHTKVFPLTGIFSLRGNRQLWRFRAFLSINRIQIVHAFMTKSAIFACLSALRSDGPAVVTSRLSTGYWYTWSTVQAFRFLNRYTTRILTNSQAARDLTIHVERVAPDKVEVIYNGVDREQYSPSSGDAGFLASLGVPAGIPVVGIVANLRPVKDLALFLRSCAIVSSGVPEARFVVVGQGPLRVQLGALAERLGISEKVVFSDGRGSVPDYLRRMSVACLSSESEGLPNAVLEYMASGLPVVATDVGGMREAVDGGVTGFLVRERTPEAFAEPILRLLGDESLRLEMSRRALERCRAKFDICTTVRALERYYDGMLRAPGEGGQP